jgi:hypothetical protein
MAYSCTFEHCDSGLFESRIAWKHHELAEHRRDWQCPSCQIAFDTRGSVARHISTEHPATEDGLMYALVTAASPQHTSAKVSDCSFCDDYHASRNVLHPQSVSVQQVSIDVHQRHLSRHMEQLALFAILPTDDGEDDDHDDDEASGDDMNRNVDEVDDYDDEDDNDDDDDDDVVEQSSQEARFSTYSARHMDVVNALNTDPEFVARHARNTNEQSSQEARFSTSSARHMDVVNALNADPEFVAHHARNTNEQSSQEAKNSEHWARLMDIVIDADPEAQFPSDFRHYGLGLPERRNSLADLWPDSEPPDPSKDIPPTYPPGQNLEVADPGAYTGPTEKDARDPLPDSREYPSPTTQERMRVLRLSGHWVCCECRQTNLNKLAPTRCTVDGHYKCRSCRVFPDQRDYPSSRDQDVDGFQHPELLHPPPLRVGRKNSLEIPEPEITPLDTGAYAGPTQKDARDLLPDPINPSSPTDQDSLDARLHDKSEFAKQALAHIEKAKRPWNLQETPTKSEVEIERLSLARALQEAEEDLFRLER